MHAPTNQILTLKFDGKAFATIRQQAELIGISLEGMEIDKDLINKRTIGNDNRS